MSQSTAAHSDPPEGSEPLSWGWYATPEIQEPTELEISGTIPSWISGSLYRGEISYTHPIPSNTVTNRTRGSGNLGCRQLHRSTLVRRL